MRTAKELQEIIVARLSRPRSNRVIVRRCDAYDPDAIGAIVRGSLADLGVRAAGRVLIKPNVVTANKKYIHDSYTHPRVIGQIARWAKAGGADAVTIGESSGFGIPPGLFLSEAGYPRLARDGVALRDFNHEPAVRVPLARGMHHTSMLVAESLADADTLIWAPKLKYHVTCQITCAIKLNVGILTHAERMLFHDDRLDEKIVDLLEIGYPDAIVTDAITIGHGYESAARPAHVGAILIADDPVAMDIVAARIMGYEPSDVQHLHLAMERGYGPAPGDVRIEGDVSIDELAAKTRGIDSEYQDLQKTKTPIRFFAGTDPVRGRYCFGGCEAAVKGCLGTIEKRRPGSVARAKAGAIVTGVYRGDVDVGDGVVALVGTCTRVTGTIRARKVRHIPGCPIGTARLLFTLPLMFRLPSPMMDVRDALAFVWFGARHLWRRVTLRLSIRAA